MLDLMLAGRKCDRAKSEKNRGESIVREHSLAYGYLFIGLQLQCTSLRSRSELLVGVVSVVVAVTPIANCKKVLVVDRAHAGRRDQIPMKLFWVVLAPPNINI